MANIVDLLVKIQLLDERQHDAVMSRTRSTSGGHVVQQVAELGYATEGTVARAISVELGLPRIDLSMTPPEPAAVALLDARTCADRFLLPVALRENGDLLWLAMADPTDQESIGVVRRKTGKRVRPAVAGPSEILRAVRTLYSAPNAGTGKPESVQDEKLAAIEIANDGAEAQQEAFEVVNVSESLGGEGTPLSRIARQLGVEVPAHLPSHRELVAAALPQQPPASAPPPRSSLEELFSTGRGGVIETDDLTEEDLSTLRALRASMEKGALVLRSLAELCVEKGLLTREEMKRRNQKA